MSDLTHDTTERKGNFKPRRKKWSEPSVVLIDDDAEGRKYATRSGIVLCSIADVGRWQ
jgi:hypothetical protein